MPFLYSSVGVFTWYSCNMFFRDITLVNTHNIPKDGATIIYGNHNNQFVDGMVSYPLSSSSSMQSPG